MVRLSDAELLKLARPNHKRCSGRGFDGTYQDGTRHVCSCVLNRMNHKKAGQVMVVANPNKAGEKPKIDPDKIF